MASTVEAESIVFYRDALHDALDDSANVFHYLSPLSGGEGGG